MKHDDTRIPDDLATIAAARGLTLTRKAGAYVARDTRGIRLTTRSAAELRRWLQGVESVITTKGY